MNVEWNIKKMRISLDQNFFVWPLPKYTGTIIFFIKVFCVPHVEFAHEVWNSLIPQLGHEQMVMVAHKTERMYVDQRDSFRRFHVESAPPVIRINIILVIEYEQIMEKAPAVGVVQNDLA